LALYQYFVGYRLQIIFLIVFIVIETFVLTNFFVAVIVNNLQANQMHMKKKMKKIKAKEEVDAF
jgi:hypothetical protein